MWYSVIGLATFVAIFQLYVAHQLIRSQQVTLICLHTHAQTHTHTIVLSALEGGLYKFTDGCIYAYTYICSSLTLVVMNEVDG
jgi:hypothetical protein